MPQTIRNSRIASIRTQVLVGAALLLLIAGWALARSASPRLSGLGAAPVIPDAARLDGDTWYWLEGAPGLPRNLYKYKSMREKVADSVVSFDVSDGALYWAQKTSAGWEIRTESDGQTVLWHGSVDVSSVKLSGPNLYFLARARGADPSSPLPPLADTVSLWCVATAGGQPRKLAELMESEPGAILYVGPKSVLLTALRPGTPGAAVVYEVPVHSGKASRLFGTEGRGPIVRAEDGAIYWVGPSRESSEFLVDSSVSKRGPDGHTSSVLDWMPSGGALCASGSDVYYIDSSIESSIWRARMTDSLPRPMELPAGFGGVAVSNGKALLYKRDSTGGVNLSEMALK